jgi:cytochrome c553
MVGLVISILGVIILALGFIWLATRAGRSRYALVRWLGVFFSGLLGLVFAAVAVLAVVGVIRLNTPPYQYSSATSAIPVTGAPGQVERGKQLAMLCTGCHSSTGSLPLDGSKDNFLAGGPPFGVLYAPNLTPSGPIKDWTDAQVARAIREGVDNNAHPLVIMPSESFHSMSDEDAYALVAYLRSQPPAPRQLPPPDFNVVAHAVFGAGVFPTSAQLPITGPVTAPPRAATAEYGHYLSMVVGCRDCHGANLTGGSPGFGPVGPNLTAIVPHWSQADFTTFFKTGVAPGGAHIDPDVMPWKDYSNALSSDDLQALYLYLHTLPMVNPTAK